jgi:hypothetical protein
LIGDKIKVDLEMIHNDPDDAGLIGAAHLLPPWMLKGHDTMLAVDIGGTNIRVGTVELNIGKSRDLVKSKWRTQRSGATRRTRQIGRALSLDW